eukprot:755877-Hanusia_phi.AAC.5
MPCMMLENLSETFMRCSGLIVNPLSECTCCRLSKLGDVLASEIRSWDLTTLHNLESWESGTEERRNSACLAKAGGAEESLRWKVQMLKSMRRQARIPQTVIVTETGVWLNDVRGIFRVLQPIISEERTVNMVRDRGTCRDWTFAASLTGDVDDTTSSGCSNVATDLLRPKRTNPVMILGDLSTSLELARIFRNSRISCSLRAYGSTSMNVSDIDELKVVVAVVPNQKKISEQAEDMFSHRDVALLKSIKRDLVCFVLLLDSAQLSRTASASMAGCVILKRSSPIRYSVSLDANISPEQDISKLVSAAHRRRSSFLSSILKG